jgi:hypothetical protein
MTALKYNLDNFPNCFDLTNAKPFYIGINGFAGVGKDTFAKLLRKELSLIHHGQLPAIEHFARPIKEAYVALYGKALGFNYSDTEDFDWKNQINPFTNITHRREFQLLGTELTKNRVGNEMLHTQLLWARTHWWAPSVILIPDLRFPNSEVSFVKQHGIAIKVIRPQSDNAMSDKSGETSHSSEQSLPDHLFDYVINNDCDITKLSTFARELARDLFVKSGVNLSSESFKDDLIRYVKKR